MSAPNYIAMPNRKIAEAMITAGIQFARPEDEPFSPCINEYTPGWLRDRKVIGSNGMSPKVMEITVLDVAERGVRLAEMGKNENECCGSVTYFFQRTKEAEDFIEAWDAMSELIQGHKERESMDDATRANVDAPRAVPAISAVLVAQVLCMHANNLKTIAKLPFVNAPICNTLGERKKVSPERGKIYEDAKPGRGWGETSGAGKVWSTSLNNQDRLELKLHPKIRDWKGPKV